MTTYYEDYAPKDQMKFEEILKVLRRCASKEAFDFRVLLFTFDLSYDRQDLTVALGRVERERGWKE